MKIRVRWLLPLLTVGLLVAATWMSPSVQKAAGSGQQPEFMPENIPATGYQSPGGRHKVEVTDKAAADKLQKRGGKLIADYGGFKVFEVDTATAEDVRKNKLGQVRDEHNVILLNARKIDTTTEAAQEMRKTPTKSLDGGMRLVQFAGPIKDEWYKALEATGVEIVTYIPMNAYLVHGDAGALKRVKQLAEEKFVQWEGEYLPEYKIQPDRRPRDEKTGEVLAKGENPEDQNLYAIQLLRNDKDGNVTTKALINQTRLEAIRVQYNILGYTNIIVRIPDTAVQSIANQKDIVSIARYFTPVKLDERQNNIVINNLTGNVPNATNYFNFLTNFGFTQAQFTTSNFVVDVGDSGIDNATTNPNHRGLHVGGVIVGPSSSRVQYARKEGAGSGSTVMGCDGHGNLNSHIVAGFVPEAFGSGFPHADAAGFRYGLGVCPFVKVGGSAIFTPGFTSPVYPDWQARAYNDGARISTNSWGQSFGNGAYNTDSQAFDALVRDAQPTGSAFPTAGNQEMAIVFAAGNNGSGANTVGAPSTGKNVISVAAGENVHSHNTAAGGNNAAGNDGCNTPDTGADSANDIIGFSGRGPTDDGRIKPDITAPGTHVTGGVAQASQTPGANGTANTCFDASGVCALPGSGSPSTDPDNFFPMGQQFYSTSSGTSHSCPAVAGGMALVRQRFINTGALGGGAGTGVVPTPAMVKNVLMTTTRYMNGTGANDTLPSNSQGTGSMDLTATMNSIGGATTTFLRDQNVADTFAMTGETRIFTGNVATGGQPFRVGLVWTDPPGPTSGNAFINNLDLEVNVNGSTFLGNVFSGANSATGGVADIRNNAEFVFVPSATGSFVVTVRATNIAGDGVPGNGDTTDQDFSLVIVNGSVAAAPVIVPAGGTLVSEDAGCALGNSVIDPGETVTVSLCLQNIGTLSTGVTGTLQATGGVTVPSGPQSYGTLTAGGPAVCRNFTFTATGNCGDTITATLALSGGVTGSVTYNFTLGSTMTVGPTAFSNTANITIPDVPGGPPDLGVPYPSPITVSGLTGTVSKVTLSLTGLSHTFPDDIDIVVVGPGGQRCIVMSDAGFSTDITGVNLTFDDAAGSQLPDTGTIVSGTFLPSNFGTPDDFPAPGPGSISDVTGLAAFNGTNPNGTWNLFVVDDAGTDSGSISGGWTLNITTAAPVCCGGGGPTCTDTLTTLLAADTTNNRVQEFDGTNWTVLMPSGITAGRVTAPKGVTQTTDGMTVYVAEANRIQKSTDGGTTWAVISTGPGLGLTQVNAPAAVAVKPDDGNFVAVCDTGNHRVKLSTDGGTTWTVLAPTGTTATTSGVTSPQGVVVGCDGSVYVADTGNSRILYFAGPTPTAGTGVIIANNAAPTGLNRVNAPRGVAIDNATGDVYVADTGNGRVVKYTGPVTAAMTVANCTLVFATGSLTAGQVVSPHGVSVTSVGGGPRLYVSDGNSATSRILRTSTLTAPFTPFAQVNGALAGQTGGFGSLLGQFRSPAHLR